MKHKPLVILSLLIISTIIISSIILYDFSLPLKEAIAQTTLNFYVATNGNDITGNGDIGDPFATLEKARDAIRLQRGVSATVWIRGGTYQLTQSFTLTSQDSGTAQAPIIYQNYNNEEVHIIGGKKLTPANWKILQPGAIRDRLKSPAKSAVYQIDLKTDEGTADFGSLATRSMQLFFDGNPMTLAKYPNTGWLKTKGPSGTGFTHYSIGDPIPGTWANTEDVYAYGFWWYQWAAYHFKFTSITNDGDYKLNFENNPLYYYGITADRRFYFYNIPEELDSPGEYYIDRSNGILYFWPPSNVALKDSYVSLLNTPLINISNVNYTTFRGLIFENTRGQALLADTCDHLVVDGCTIRNIGGRKDYSGQWPNSPWLSYAIAIKVSTNSGVINCQVYNTSDGGIYLHGGNRINETPSHNFAKNNIIHHTNQWNMTGSYPITINGLVGGGANEVGIGDMVSHNLIYDVPSIAIYMGGDQHIIEFNEIYNTCLQTSDIGAIYAGANPTEHDNIIRYNYIHNINDIGVAGVYGVYFDAKESGFKVYGNVFDNVDTPVFINAGSNHTIANNVFVNSNSVRNNDILITATTPPPTGNKVLANIHYAPVTKVPFMRVENEPDLVKINNWTRGDPSFINYGNKNFQLASNSPAWQLGFQRIKIEEIGPNSTVVGQDMTFNNLPNPTDPVKILKSNFQNGLKLYLPFGEGYGQDITFDQSGNNNNGALLGGVSWLGPNLGKLGNGIAVDGAAGSYVSVASNLSLTTQSARTVSFWMKTTSNNGIIMTFGGGNSTYGAFLLDNSTPRLFLNDGNYRDWVNVAPYLNGNWHHWVYVITGTGQNDIVDATLKIDNNIIASAITPHTNPIKLWAEHRIGGGYYSINASMDEIMIWNRVLTPAEITDLYNLNIFESGAPTTEPNIVLTKTANKTQASAGEEIIYTIAYQNIGAGNATDMIITDSIPTGATYVAGSASNSGTLSGSTLTWNIGNIAIGISGTVNFRVRMD